MAKSLQGVKSPCNYRKKEVCARSRKRLPANNEIAGKENLKNLSRMNERLMQRLTGTIPARELHHKEIGMFPFIEGTGPISKG